MEQWLRLLGPGCRQISEVKGTLENPELYSTIIRWSPVFENSRGQAIKEYLKIVFRSRWCLHRSLVENEEELYSNVKQACRADFALFPETGIPMDHEELFHLFHFFASPIPAPRHFVRRRANRVLIHDILTITFENGAWSVKWPPHSRLDYTSILSIIYQHLLEKCQGKKFLSVTLDPMVTKN